MNRFSTNLVYTLLYRHKKYAHKHIAVVLPQHVYKIAMHNFLNTPLVLSGYLIFLSYQRPFTYFIFFFLVIDDMFTSHMKSYYYFVESVIVPYKYRSFEASSWKAFLNNNTSKVNFMGEYVLKEYAFIQNFQYFYSQALRCTWVKVKG